MNTHKKFAPPNSFKCSFFHNRDNERKTSAEIKEKNGSLSEAGALKNKNSEHKDTCFDHCVSNFLGVLFANSDSKSK